MALSIDKKTDLTADVYGINSYVNEIKKKFTPEVNEDTLMLGIFGYTGQIFSDMLQNTIVMASEFSNESIATRAKFEKNIIAHALGLGFTDINATPAQFDVLLTFIEDDIIEWAHKGKANKENLPWEFVFDKDTPIYIGDYCYHVDYDIIIRKVLLEHAGEENKFAYTAMYDIDIDNPISDVTNPYLTSPVKMRVNGMNVIFTKCTLHQVEYQTVYKKVLADNSISSKTVTFDFEGQLAAFTIDVTEGTTTTHMVPVYDGLNIEVRKYPYFYYSYLDSNTIRIKFDRSSYAPRINSEVKINLYITQGESGNFSFNPEVYPGYTFESEKYRYSNIGCEIRPVTGESAYGADKKTIEDLKKIIPKEALSRGSITNMADLENYFNMLNTDMSKCYFYKKRDNALHRLYYSFMVMKDALNNIIPTNTIDIRVKPEQLQTEEGSNKLVFKKGQIINLINDIGYIQDPEAESDYGASFSYVIPYNFIINTSPMYGMYFLNVIDTDKYLDFSYINDQCLYQFIATSIHWYRGYLVDSNTYELSITLEQNVEDEVSMFNRNEETGEIDGCKVRCIAVFYNDEDKPLRWAEAEFVGGNPSSNLFSFKFKFTTEDYIDINNKIRIDTGLYDIGTNTESYAHLDANTKCVIHIVSDQSGTGISDLLNELDQIVPGLDGLVLSNSYTITEGLDFFYDYSEIIDSVITTQGSDDGDGQTTTDYFTIKSVPVIKYDYFDSEDKVLDFCKELVSRKNYIDYAIQILEDAFGMDFKFFNTYGPSKLFTLDNELALLNRTNLSLTFNLKLKPNYDTNIVNDIIEDIKSYVETINSIDSLHMPNLITYITNIYEQSIVFFEFVDCNGYGPGVQHLYSMGMPEAVITPEFLNIQTLPDNTPDITINMA